MRDADENHTQNVPPPPPPPRETSNEAPSIKHPTILPSDLQPPPPHHPPIMTESTPTPPPQQPRANGPSPPPPPLSPSRKQPILDAPLHTSPSPPSSPSSATQDPSNNFIASTKASPSTQNKLTLMTIQKKEEDCCGSSTPHAHNPYTPPPPPPHAPLHYPPPHMMMMMMPQPPPPHDPYFHHMMFPPPNYYQHTPFQNCQNPGYPTEMYSEYPDRRNQNIQRSWSTGLYDCFSDPKNTFITMCCPCFTFGQIAEIVNEGQTPWWEAALIYWIIWISTLSSFTILYECFYRVKMRKKYMLKGNWFTDFFISCLCHPCALCQGYRQLDRLGFNVALGWEKNKEKQRRKAMEALYQVPPYVEQGMFR